MIRVPRALQAEKAMAPHSSVLTWKIPGMGESGELPSMRSQSWTQLKEPSSSTSRLPFRNIARSPEPVPPPTMFLQVSAPNLIAGSSTFDESFGLFLINSLTDCPLVKCRYSSFMFTAAHVSRVEGREQAESPQASDLPFWVEISWVPGTG